VLRDQIVVTSGQGFSARLREAAVDMKAGNVVSRSARRGDAAERAADLPTAWRSSSRARVIRFNRGVVLTLDARKTTEAAK